MVDFDDDIHVVPLDIRKTSSAAVFKAMMKMHLFSESFK